MLKDGIKEDIRFCLNLLISAVAVYAFITLALYPRPASVSNSTGDERWFKESYHELPMLDWGDGTLDKLMEYAQVFEKRLPEKPKAKQDGGPMEVMSGPKEIQRVFVLSHRSGFVSGAVLWEIKGESDLGFGKYWIRFRIPDNRLPPVVKAQVRRYDLSGSRRFLSLFIGAWVFLAVILNTYPEISRKLTVLKAADARRESSLEEFKRYMSLRRQVAEFKRKGFSGVVRREAGDPWHTLRFTWREMAITTLFVLAVVYAVSWSAYIDPPFSRGEVIYMVRTAMHMS